MSYPFMPHVICECLSFLVELSGSLLTNIGLYEMFCLAEIYIRFEGRCWPSAECLQGSLVHVC